jgi:hypothetical protein
MPQNAEDKLTTCCGSAVADRSKTTVYGTVCARTPDFKDRFTNGRFWNGLCKRSERQK